MTIGTTVMVRRNITLKPLYARLPQSQCACVYTTMCTKVHPLLFAVGMGIEPTTSHIVNPNNDKSEQWYVSATRFCIDVHVTACVCYGDI